MGFPLGGGSGGMSVSGIGVACRVFWSSSGSAFSSGSAKAIFGVVFLGFHFVFELLLMCLSGLLVSFVCFLSSI